MLCECCLVRVHIWLLMGLSHQWLYTHCKLPHLFQNFLKSLWLIKKEYNVHLIMRGCTMGSSNYTLQSSSANMACKVPYPMHYVGTYILVHYKGHSTWFGNTWKAEIMMHLQFKFFPDGFGWYNETCQVMLNMSCLHSYLFKSIF